jgi:hypothetical protein
MKKHQKLLMKFYILGLPSTTVSFKQNIFLQTYSLQLKCHFWLLLKELSEPGAIEINANPFIIMIGRHL